MSDEIKKILDIERYINKDGYIENINLSPDEIHKLYDYITNLQEENEYSNHCNEELRKKITNLRYKIERLEEDNKQLKELCDKYEEEHSTKFNEWVFDKRENERLKQIIKDNTILVKDENGNYQECNINPLDYKSRNEKAILFIDNYLKIIDNSDINMQIVKDILQGDDKE